MRIGKFGYINNYLPYYHLEKEGVAEIVESSPKDMIDLIEYGKIDYAPIPSFYYLKNKDRLKRYKFCVASDGRVYSVIVVSRDGKVGDEIGVTCETTTSLNLLKIVLEELNLRCKLIPTGKRFAEEILRDFDSALVIGDSAIKAIGRFEVIMDLGEVWKEITGYPMVFGISSSLKDVKECDEIVLKSLKWGLKNFDIVVKSASLKFGLSEDFLNSYFKSLKHVMDKKCERGLRAFEELCKDYGLL